jgi:hypothetical protein
MARPAITDDHRRQPRPEHRSVLEGGGSIDYPWWAFTFWHGMGVGTWIGLLREGNLRISPSKLGVAASITLLSLVNSLARVLTDWKYARRMRACPLPSDPIFIIGHWRSGTTFLHELMMLDQRLCTPSTYQCFAPGHFMTTRGFTRRRYAQGLLPGRRPGDNVRAGWDRPQEDEFALMNLGAPSPYRRIAFPSQHSPSPQALDISRLSSHDQERWKNTMRAFVVRLRLKNDRRLALKSPTHTARIASLLELFPNARFIHLSRNPFLIFASTKRLWQALHATQSLETGQPPDLDDYIDNCFQEMQAAYRRDKPLLGSNQLYELRYEDLVRDPLACLRDIYETLEIGDFAPMEEALLDYLPQVRRYQTNTYRLSDELKARIAERWSDYFSSHSYSTENGEVMR